MLFKKPTIFSEPIANIKKGRLLIIIKCEKEWCKIKSESFKGWVDKKNLWGSIN
jgi:SH3-like domain-containing protein